MSVQLAYQPTLMELRAGFTPGGWLAEDVPAFFMRNECPRAAAHCADVAMAARQPAGEVWGGPLAGGGVSGGGWGRAFSGWLPHHAQSRGERAGQSGVYRR